MGFLKTADVQSLGTATFDDATGLRRIAAVDETPAVTKSYYVDGARKIDVKAILKEVAAKYDISDDPAHYIFEAIRANTVNVPNENHDGFHKNELLRFSTQLAKAVYLTYIGKPHHLNHKTDDPKRARGVILDSHYNDEAPALANCPTCNYRTAEENGRDPSGIHCAKCGSIAKDEFVEILVAVDTRKDPALARGIQNGILNAGSMGCNCASTICNVCQHVARSTSEFCEHIRSGSKGSLWLRKGQKFERTTADKVKVLLKSAAYSCTFDGNQLVSVSLVIPERDIEVRKAFEYCQGVEFDEYSRVHRPADPKARTVEILKAAEASQVPLTIEQETEQLIVRARLATLEISAMTKAASQTQTYFAVRVNGNDEDIHVAASLQEAVKAAELGARDRGEYLALEASSPKQALTLAIHASLSKSAQYLPMSGDVNLVVPDGVKVHLDQPNQPVDPNRLQAPGAPDAPGSQAVQPGQPNSIEDVTQQKMQPEDPQQSPEEFGMLPPGASLDGLEASAESDDMKGDLTVASEEPMEQKYASVYGDFQVEVFEDRAVISSPGGDIFTVKAEKKLATDNDKRFFGGSIIDSVLTDGLVRTAMRYKARFDKRIADSTEGAMWNMAGGRPDSGGGALEGHIEPMKELRQEGKDIATSGGATDGAVWDNKGSRPMPSNSIESRNTNLADHAEVASPKTDALDGHEEPQKEKRPSKSEDSLSGATTNMKANAGGDSSPKIAALDEAKAVEERVKRLYAARLEKVKAEFEAEKKALEQTLVDRFARALKVAAKRATLNIETSPLKATMLDSLTVARSVGRSASTGQPLEYAGIDTGLALHLVEAAWADAADEEVNSLVTRAAELMGYDDRYLVSAESDLSKQAAVIPSVGSEEQLAPVDEVQRRAASLREAVAHGNLTLAPGSTDSGVMEDKVSAIRAALGPTRVSRMLSEEFRPSA